MPPKLKGKDEYEGVSKDSKKLVQCDVEEEHIAAEQIFPIIINEHYYTPTVKHHCPRVALASSLRACSNKVHFDRKVLLRFSDWWRKTYIPKFMKFLDEELVNVDFDLWISKFPVQMQNKLRESISVDKQRHNFSFIYEAFTKVEKQFTTVPHSEKETPLNDCKERQICGPTDAKKAMANPFIYFLEGVASKYMEEYCGRANWIEICESLDKMSKKFGNLTFGASDGSGFDMTQFKEMNMLLNELLRAAAYHPNINWMEPLNASDFMKIVEGSLDLFVSVDNGKLMYNAEGRASGDGWTTFGNTMLMIAYWSFTFEIAGIKEYILKVKGDDVLFGLSKRDKPALLEAIKVVFTDKKSAHNHGLGQICKKVDFGDLTQLDFLSNEFFLTKEGNYRMTRIPARVIQSCSWSTKVPKGVSEKVAMKFRRELIYSNGMCLKAWASGLPIFGVLADKMISLGRPSKRDYADQYSDFGRVWHDRRDDREEYLVYLEERYGLTPTEVSSVEAKIKAINCLSGTVDLPELEKLYHKIVC